MKEIYVCAKCGFRHLKQPWYGVVDVEDGYLRYVVSPEIRCLKCGANETQEKLIDHDEYLEVEKEHQKMYVEYRQRRKAKKIIRIPKKE